MKSVSLRMAAVAAVAAIVVGTGGAALAADSQTDSVSCPEQLRPNLTTYTSVGSNLPEDQIFTWHSWNTGGGAQWVGSGAHSSATEAKAGQWTASTNTTFFKAAVGSCAPRPV